MVFLVFAILYLLLYGLYKRNIIAQVFSIIIQPLIGFIILGSVSGALNLPVGPALTVSIVLLFLIAAIYIAEVKDSWILRRKMKTSM